MNIEQKLEKIEALQNVVACEAENWAEELARGNPEQAASHLDMVMRAARLLHRERTKLSLPQ